MSFHFRGHRIRVVRKPLKLEIGVRLSVAPPLSAQRAICVKPVRIPGRNLAVSNSVLVHLVFTQETRVRIPLPPPFSASDEKVDVFVSKTNGLEPMQVRLLPSRPFWFRSLMVEPHPYKVLAVDRRAAQVQPLPEPPIYAPCSSRWIEQLPCKHQAVGSWPTGGSTFIPNNQIHAQPRRNYPNLRREAQGNDCRLSRDS